MKLLHQTPFLRVLLFFILGIVIQSYWDFTPFFLFAGVLSFFIIALSYVPNLNKQYNFRFLFGWGFSFFLFVIATYSTKLTWEKSEWKIEPVVHLYEGRVIEEPILKPKTYLCKIRIVSAEEAIYKDVVDKKVVIYLPIDTFSKTVAVGETLSFYGQFEQSPLYLQKKSFAAIGFIRQKHWFLKQDSNRSFSILEKSLSIRRILLDRLQKIIPDHSTYSIASALMFGYKDELDKDLQQSFANIGASHVLAVSGLHFAIVFGMVYFMLSFLGNSLEGRLIKQLVVFPLLWGFAFITGFSPSVVRAALMLTVWGIGNAFFYKSFTLNTVAIAAFFMLLFNPLYLFDVGFQLSFMAVVSIILVNPYLNRLYESKNPMIKYVWELCCVSVSVQTGVLPVSAYYFHQISLLFLITNLCVIPLVTILLFLIPFSLLFDALFGNIPALMYPLNKGLELFLSTVRFLDEIPYGSIHSIDINFREMTVWFIAMILILLIFIKKRIFYLYLLLILIVCEGIYSFY
ncbi:MAG: ComEC/Rec2 family competence protein [Dysgonamonadaceae bacterium]|jgi:competence protein ComEC|nr:ComEC/Rec2 family competence protein [Dysgonamonadaceae bacterium]